MLWCLTIGLCKIGTGRLRDGYMPPGSYKKWLKKILVSDFRIIWRDIIFTMWLSNARIWNIVWWIQQGVPIVDFLFQWSIVRRNLFQNLEECFMYEQTVISVYELSSICCKTKTSWLCNKSNNILQHDPFSSWHQSLQKRERDCIAEMISGLLDSLYEPISFLSSWMWYKLLCF